MDQNILLTMEELKRLWKLWVNDSNRWRFGQYVMHMKLPAMHACPSVYFADTGTAWELLSNHAAGVKPLNVIRLGGGEYLEECYI